MKNFILTFGKDFAFVRNQYHLDAFGEGLSAGEDPDQYLYSDELMHYFAIQNYILNHDGYTGSMLHNYYLCEKDGRLAK